MAKFSAQIDNFKEKTEKKIEAVFKQSVQDTFSKIVTRWPVDTGFSRASFGASTSGFSPVSMAKPVKGQTYAMNEQYSAVIAGAKLGQTIYGNFTANYAIYIEYGAKGRAGRAIVRTAAMEWPQTVAANVAKVR